MFRHFLIALCAMLIAGASSARAAETDLIGQIRHHVVAGDETLLEIARANSIGYVEMRAANPGVDPWLPGAGREVMIPSRHILPDAPRTGIVVNTGDMRLYYFPENGGPAQSFAIGIGQQADAIPTGRTRIARKREHPAWTPTADARRRDPTLPRVMAPGPWNPLGDYALDLGWDAYLIHGTNAPWGIGRRVSGGCLRLYPENIEYLYGLVHVGTRVTVVDQPVKAGWAEGVLYLEVHPSGEVADRIEQTGEVGDAPPADVVAVVLAAANSHDILLNWRAIRRAAQERRGVPVPILR